MIDGLLCRLVELLGRRAFACRVEICCQSCVIFLLLFVFFFCFSTLFFLVLCLSFFIVILVLFFCFLVFFLSFLRGSVIDFWTGDRGVWKSAPCEVADTARPSPPVILPGWCGL